MKKGAKKVNHLRKGVVFASIGVVCAVIGAALLWGFVELLHLEKQVAFAGQLIICIQINFILNYFFTWSEERGKGSLKQKFLRHQAVRFLTMIANQLAFTILILLMPYMAAYAVAVVLVSALSYILSTKFVFVVPQPQTATPSSWVTQPI